jgi:putrescine transport system permease protein
MRRGALTTASWAALVFGFVFLYAPILLLAAYSFNASRLVTVWGGLSARWYGELWRDTLLLDSARTSATVALASASLATVLGTLAAFALARFGSFRGRVVFSALLFAPIILPETITGLSMLLLFVALGVDRGWLTIVVAHATLSIGFVAIVVQARLRALDPALEEAAADLGAGPGMVFWRIILPLSAPAIVSGFLLATILSLDDLVLASFTSGPGATTLPMRVYSAVRLGVTPEVNAISTLLLAAVGAGLCVFGVLMRGRGRARIGWRA